jgi:hypothetical protein
MTRPNAFQSWLKPKPSEQQNELKNLVLTAQTSKVAYQAVKKRGFRGSYDSVLNFRNANKSGSVEAIAAIQRPLKFGTSIPARAFPETSERGDVEMFPNSALAVHTSHGTG